MNLWILHGLLLPERRGRPGSLLAVLIGALLSLSTAAVRLYTLTPPPYYTVFSGDLEFNYSIPGDVSLPHAFVRLEFWRESTKELVVITTMGLKLGLKSGTLIVACGVIEFAGKHTLKMYKSINGDVLAETPLDVRWPEVGLSLPDTQDAQTSPVEVRVISSAICSSLLHRHYFQLKLLFQRINLGGDILKASSGAQEVFVTNFTSIDKSFSTVVLGCYLFDLDGAYQVVMNSSATDSPVVVISNIMTVKWSNAYHLGTAAQSVFPCEHSLRLVYTHPSCSEQNKLRLYSFVTMSEGSPASPMERLYVTEMATDLDKSMVAFDCKLFNDTANGFCFIYISISRTAVVSEQKQLCLPANPNSVFPIDGGWSKWTSWSSCSVTCGAGRKNRFRMCNEPPPKHGGRYCQGDPVEWIPCELHCPEAIPKTPLHSPHIDPTCACGCTRTNDTGKIIATGRCPGLSIWTVETKAGHVIALRFDYIRLNYTRQWVKIRDGTSPSDILLFSSTSQGYPLETVTTGAAMRVEFMTSYVTPPPANIFPKNATLPIHAHGFIASYDVRAILLSSTAPSLFQYEKETILNSTITIVGIVICGVVIIIAIVFVIVQRMFFRRRVKYSMATSGESPAHQMTSSMSEHRASSSSPSSPGNVIQVDMEMPLTGRPQGKGSGGKTSRTSSVSSARSQKSRKLKNKADAAASGSRVSSSPQPSSKDCTNITSPYGIEIIDTDEHSGVSGSPSKTKNLKPSRVQASSNHRPSPHTPQSPITKLDMLSKKRQEKKGKGVTADLERDLTGSSGSRTPSTTKAEVNWPQGSIVMAALNEVGKSFSERNKRAGQRPTSEEIPLIDSMTSSQESPSHTNNLVKSESADSATTSFVRPSASNKVRRPTSLTESYSNESIQKSKPKTEHDSQDTEKKEPAKNSLAKKLVQLPPPSTSRSSVNNNPQPSTTTTTTSAKPTAHVKPSSSQASLVSTKSLEKPKKTAFEERQTILPKPDGQSPRLQRHESPTSATNGGVKKDRTTSPGRASSRGSKNTVSSPVRSLATPSEIEGLELEYDDFIEDDPLSYFDYEETQKLAFRGGEKIGRTPEEEEEDEV